MSDVVLGIRLTIDGKDVSGEIRGQAAELQKLGQAAQQSNRQAKSASDEFVSSLKKQADTLGMTRTQTIAYEASQQQLTTAQREQVAANIKAIDTHERNEKILGRVRLAAAAAGAAIVAVATVALRQMISASIEAEQSGLRLEAVLRSTGYAAQLNVRELDAMAESLKQRTGIDDDEVRRSMAVLLTFKSVARDSFGEAMEVAVNLSKVMGTDLQSAVLQLGKALEEPETGLTALRRSGVSFTQTQQDMIKELSETGRQAQAITMILQIMKQQGLDQVAESMNQGLFKAINNSKLEWDDFLKALGRTDTVTTPVEGLFNLMTKRLRELKELVEMNWVDRALLLYSGGLIDRRKPQTGEQPIYEGELRHVQGLDAASAQQKAAREQVSGFLKQFQGDNEKLAQELTKFRALAKAAGLTAAEIAAGEAKITSKMAKPGEGAQLILSLKDQLAAFNPEATEVDKVTRQLTESGKKYTEGEKSKALAIAAEIDQRKIQKQALDNYIRTEEFDQQLQQEVADVMAKREDARRQGILGAQQALDTAQDGVKLAEYELSLMNRSETERSVMLAQFRVEEDWRRKINELKRQGVLLDGDEERLRGQASDAVAAAGREARAKASQKLIEDTKTAAKKLDEDLQRGLTDSIFRGFEAGKGFAENFRDSLVNMFKTTILRPVVQWIVSPVTGAIAASLGSLGVPGLANAAGGGAGGLGGLGSLFNVSNLPGMGNPFGGGAFDILGGLAGAGNAVFQNLGVSAGSQFLADIGNFGYGNPLLAAGLNLLAGNTRGALFSGGLGALGTALGGPVGGLIGSVAGSFLGGLGGGGGPASFTGIDVNANLSQSGFAGQLFGTSKNSDTSFRWPTFIPGNLQETANAAVASAFSQMTMLAQQMGLDPSRLAGVSANVSFHSASHDAGVITQDLVNNLGVLTDQMAQALLPNLKEFAQAGETATQTLLRLVQVQDQLRQQEASATDQLKGMVNSLPGQLGITSLQQFQNSLKVSDTLAPLDRLNAAKGLLSDNYARALAGDLSAVNAFPNVAQQLLGIGRDTFASGPQFQELFVQVNRELQDVLSHQKDVQSDLLKNIDVSIISSAQEQTAELQKIRNAIDDMNASLQATQAELRRIAA